MLYSEYTIEKEYLIEAEDHSGKVHIEELTYNTLNFKYNHSKFLRGDYSAALIVFREWKKSFC